MSVEQHVIYKLRNATKQMWPFPHFFAENVFPEGFYAELMEYLHAKVDYHESGFANRAFTDENIPPGLEFMQRKTFLRHILDYFAPECQARFLGQPKTGVYRDTRLIRDQLNYKIGPHTDAKWKMVSLLFYLPDATTWRDYGTSIYVPRSPDFTCEGGPHYPFEPFDKVWTAPFIPNSCLGFWKTNQSFHGVEPIPVQFSRDILLYNIYAKEAFDSSHPKEQP